MVLFLRLICSALDKNKGNYLHIFYIYFSIVNESSCPGSSSLGVLMSRPRQSNYDRRLNDWVCKIVGNAMATTKGAGGDFAAQCEAAIKAVRNVHPYLSAEELRAALYAEC